MRAPGRKGNMKFIFFRRDDRGDTVIE